MYVYVVMSELFEKSISVFSDLEKAEDFLKTKEKRYGRHDLFKCILDGPEVKSNEFYESIHIVDL